MWEPSTTLFHGTELLMADLSWHFDGSKRRTAKIVLFVQTREVCMDINVSSGFVFFVQ